MLFCPQLFDFSAPVDIYYPFEDPRSRSSPSLANHSLRYPVQHLKNMSDEKIESPIKAEIGVKAEITANIPDQSIEAGTNALLDVISPFTQGLGAIGDHIRFYREDLLIKHLARARATADKYNIEIRPPKPKFLVDYVEQVSLEDTDSVDLQEMWSSLLLRSSEFESEKAIIYIDILKKLTGEQAVALKELDEKRRNLIRYKFSEYRHQEIMSPEEVFSLSDMDEDDYFDRLRKSVTESKKLSASPLPKYAGNMSKVEHYPMIMKWLLL